MQSARVRLKESDVSDHVQTVGRLEPVRKNWMRNKACPCKSGKKFKRCCWAKFN